MRSSWIAMNKDYLKSIKNQRNVRHNVYGLLALFWWLRCFQESWKFKELKD